MTRGVEFSLEDKARVESRWVVPARGRSTRRRRVSPEGMLAIVNGFRRSLFKGEAMSVGSER